jgi:hypothetical protein
MKNWKQSVSFGMVAIIALGFGFIGCDDDDGKDDPKEQGETITVQFDKGYSVRVEGYLTDNEWNGAPNKIKAALEAEYAKSGKAMFEDVFGQEDYDTTIILEKNPSYANYSTTDGDTRTICINFAILNDINVLGTALRNASGAIFGLERPAVGKVYIISRFTPSMA